MQVPRLNELKGWRERLGITQMKAATSIGITQSYLARIESGSANPGYKLILKLSDYYAQIEGMPEDTVENKFHKGVDSVEPHETLERAASLMKWKGYSQLPVIKGGQNMGSVTEAMVSAKIHEVGRDIAMKMAVSDVMGTPFAEVDERSPLSLAAAMLKHTPLVLVKKGHRYEGILTRSDLL